MNVLITSAAAKVLLVQAFKAAVSPFGGRVITADLAAQCAAGRFADLHVQVRPTEDVGAIEEVEAICRANEISLIVPTRDSELPFFVRHFGRLGQLGVTTHLCGEDALAICQDKARFGEVLVAAGLPAMPIADPSTAEFPLFVRPIAGSGGRDARRVNAVGDLPDDRSLVLIHPLIVAPEYTVDLLMDWHGKACQAVVRSRDQVVGGESKISTVVSHPKLEQLACRLGEVIGLVGHNTVQAFDHPEIGPIFIEVNPRFGGASNCSIVAGLDSPSRLIALLHGDDDARAARPIRHGLTMLRYSQDVFV